ncbi:site-specific integrase [Leptolyngbya sp. UWPOB_LEPTO1]|uniref:tyrosine-type recombinase/integrase n=1 Tax=Leptolyngbya sp. UWPOB_LEPTO1 TaxID=2815653 RepID=UPI00257E69D6|nr:site-specific integrase [Leptolyngbya sp. UWPOB_LEPTO1]
MAKSKKGSVAISVVDGRFRLRWMYFDEIRRQKRYTLSAGAENEVNRTAAEKLARTIELDIASENFDYSLRKYKQGLDRPESITVEALLDRYIKAEFSTDQTSSIERYSTIRNHFTRFQRSMTADECTEKKAISFMRYLQERGQSGETVNMNLTCIRAVWVWAIKKGLVHVNPWIDLKVDVEPREHPKPFTLDEIKKILEAFQGSHYENFVRFMLGVGCRIGEAVALDWSAINEDCSEIFIKQAYNPRSRKIKGTKTGKTRHVPVSPKIQALLQELRQSSNSEIVFPSPKGGRIDRANFRKRHWQPILERLGIEYRSPYNARHTRWSHEIESGNLSIAEAAQYAGNSPRTMLDRYYGATKRPRLQDFD